MLKKEPREVLVALCAREALRKLPFVQTAKHDGYEECLVLPIFRATAALWAFANYPRPDIERAATRADKIIDARLRPAILRKALFSADAKSASEAALGLMSSAFNRNRGAAAALRADAAAIASGHAFQNILARKLWPAARPREITRLWKELKQDLLAANRDFQVWAKWYDARSRGKAAVEAIEAARVTLCDEIWQKGAKFVNREIIELTARHEVRKRPEIAPNVTPEVPPLRPAALEPAWSRGRLILPQNPSGTGSDYVVLAAALKLLRSEIWALAEAGERYCTIDKRSIACLRNVAVRIPGFVPAQNEIFFLAHVNGFLEGNSRVIHDMWPEFLATRYDEVTRHLDRTVRQFPRWCDFVSNAEEEQLTSDQIAELSRLATRMVAALREDKAKDLIDPAIPLALEVFHAPLQSGIENTGEQMPGTMTVSMLLLANDLLLSVDNVAKRVAETTLANNNTGAPKATADEADAALAIEEKDGGEAYSWMTRTLEGIVKDTPLAALRSKFSWLDPVIALFRDS